MINEHNLFKGRLINSKINLNHSSLKDVMKLKNIDEDIANDIIQFAKDTTITDNYDLLELESINVSMLTSWNDFITDMRININYVDEHALEKVKGVSKNLAQTILSKREELGQYSNINQLKQISILNKDAFENIKLRFTI